MLKAARFIFLFSLVCVCSLHAQTKPTYQQATFAMGCFWHSEEMFLEIKGVINAEPGYSGGTEKDAKYDIVSSGMTQHAESVNVTYDPSIITYGKLLQVFFSEHDPTTLNKQEPDEGRQYRSVVFYGTLDEK